MNRTPLERATKPRPAPSDPKPMAANTWSAVRAWHVLLVIAIVALGAAWILASDALAPWLAHAIGWAQVNAQLAMPAFVIVYALAGMALVPASALTLAGGFLFGLPIGVLLVAVGSMAGAIATFIAGRWLLRERLLQRYANQPQFRALDHATHHEGFLIVLLARLSPLIPFHLLSYVMSITAVRLRDFAAATLLGMLPTKVLYVYVGSLTRNLSQLTSGTVTLGSVGWLLFAAGLIATLALTVLLARRSTAALREHLRREHASLDEEQRGQLAKTQRTGSPGARSHHES